MSISIPKPQGDLANATTLEPVYGWPDSIEIVAYWSSGDRPKARSRRIEIPADEFFGLGRFGAPMSGQALIAAIDRLRRMKPAGK